MENRPFVMRERRKFSAVMNRRMPTAMAQLMGWLVKVQYS